MRTVVELPGGLYRANALITEAELRPLSTEDETWLAGCPYHAPTAHVVTELLARTITRLGPLTAAERDDVRALAVGDRDFLLLTVRRIALGPHMVAVVGCPGCGSMLDAEFETDEVPVERRRQDAPTFETWVQRAHGERMRATLRCPTGADQEALAMDGGRASGDALLARCLIELDGRPATADGLDGLDRTARDQLDHCIAQVAPRVDLAMDLDCPDCGQAFAADLELAPIVLRDLWLSARQVLHEVHELATTYHWSQTEIVSLPSGTRRAYVALIGERGGSVMEAQ